MKKILIKIGLPIVLLVAATLIVGPSCGSTVPDPVATTPTCTTTNTLFQQVFAATATANPSFQDVSTMDLLTHQYTFTVNANKTICSIGYQGNATLFANNLPYTIEIVDTTTNAVIYTGNHLFGSTATSYVSITPVNLIANQSYTIRRTLPAGGYGGNIGNTIGRILRFTSSSSVFPVTSGGFTITGSNFYGTGGPVVNFGIPYIDIVFQ
ncbi:hypothetical protein [Flavobacterium sp.]|uniref:hypothetical protein n=1 Tax=Flavobacterium sp. TaxID=239 RepID=UPI002620ACC7|nr:hypothetical protein [Flavobacterium sp.]